MASPYHSDCTSIFLLSGISLAAASRLNQVLGTFEASGTCNQSPSTNSRACSTYARRLFLTPLFASSTAGAAYHSPSGLQRLPFSWPVCAAPGGYYFHATDDPDAARKVLYDYIKTLDLSFEAVVGRKIPAIFTRKHHSRESEFYADLLSHLLKNKLQSGGDLILNIAQRGKVTRNVVFQEALDKAVARFLKRKTPDQIKTLVAFNVQYPRTEPLLNVTDYICWAVQRVFERGETRYYNFIADRVSLVIDLYDSSHYANNENYYTNRRPLTALNKISPPSY